MRALIMSDIHSNLEAFQAVLKDAAEMGGFDEAWSLGDIVGYGPDPGECIELLRQQSFVSVVGNHDLAAAGRLSTEDFNTHARAAAEWTASHIAPEHARFLADLPQVAQRDEFTLVHGSLRQPVLEYLLSAEVAMATFQLLASRFCLVGHSHIPFICRDVEAGCSFDPFPEGEPVDLGEGRQIINPGGVGQPRDRDPRPSYAIYDSDKGTIERNRVNYEVSVTQDKMRQAGLPEALIHRLNYGV